jgi:hypothetical protein
MVIIMRLVIMIKKISSSLWPFKFAFVIVVILFSAAIWIGGDNIASFSEEQQQSSQMLKPSLGVKITSPTAGQNVPIGAGELKISGTSTINNNNPSSSIGNCYVSVIVNNIKPYQNATAAGPNGINDYSKWIYTLSPQYTIIKEGENKITGKLSCLNNIGSSNINPITNTSSDLTKWYSVNVTGVAMQLSSSGAANNNVSNNQTMTATTATTTTTTSSQSIDKSNNIYTGKGKPLSISIQSSQDVVNGKGKATIRATAYDVMSGKKIDDAIVKLNVTFPYNATAKEISGYNGQAIYSIDIKPDSNNNNNRNNSFIIVTAQASAPGYIYTGNAMTTMAFNNNNDEFHGNDNNNNHFGKNINNLADKIIKDVKKKLKNGGIINVPLE